MHKNRRLGRGPYQRRMSIRFAARANALAPRLSRYGARRAIRRPANDNGSPGANITADDALLRAALRHFSENGMSAAHMARSRAEQAFFVGDRDAYQWWLDICRLLDRRMARDLDVHGVRC